MKTKWHTNDKGSFVLYVNVNPPRIITEYHERLDLSPYPNNKLNGIPPIRVHRVGEIKF